MSTAHRCLDAEISALLAHVAEAGLCLAAADAIQLCADLAEERGNVPDRRLRWARFQRIVADVRAAHRHDDAALRALAQALRVGRSGQSVFSAQRRRV